eukprot:scaffold49019_cov63-Phaeocystis_antarctica.AAC.4
MEVTEGSPRRDCATETRLCHPHLQRHGPGANLSGPALPVPPPCASSILPGGGAGGATPGVPSGDLESRLRSGAAPDAGGGGGAVSGVRGSGSGGGGGEASSVLGRSTDRGGAPAPSGGPGGRLHDVCLVSAWYQYVCLADVCLRYRGSLASIQPGGSSGSGSSSRGRFSPVIGSIVVAASSTAGSLTAASVVSVTSQRPA